MWTCPPGVSSVAVYEEGGSGSGMIGLIASGTGGGGGGGSAANAAGAVTAGGAYNPVGGAGGTGGAGGRLHIPATAAPLTRDSGAATPPAGANTPTSPR